MTSPKITVVIPSYNKVKYIKKTLDSIFDQKYPNLEVIVQDGGSTDGTLQIIEKYAVKLESKKDGGQLDAIKKGMNKATGEILSFINADDYYEKDTFKLISELYVKNPNALWFAGQGKVIDENGVEIAKAFSLYKNRLLSLNTNFYLQVTNYLMQPSVFFTKKAYENYGPFTGTSKFVMEYDFWLRLSKSQMPVVLDKVISNFRIEKDTKTKKIFNEILMEDEKTIKKYTNDSLILLLHNIHNIGRKIVGRFI